MIYGQEDAVGFDSTAFLTGARALITARASANSGAVASFASRYSFGFIISDGQKA